MTNMTKLDTRCLSDSELKEHNILLEKRIRELNFDGLEITEADLLDECCDPNRPYTLQFEEIAAAANRIKHGVEETPCTYSRLSEITGVRLYLKKELVLYTGSFKERGARYALMMLSPEQKAIGAITASRGNHALAVAYHGSQLGIPAVVVMPKYTPIMKVNNCRSYGAIVIVKGEELAESKRLAMKLSKLFGLTYINGFDHPHVLAGQGSVGLEILEQVPNVEAILVPTGGGGLLAGIATAVKSVNPKVKIISVESEHSPGFRESFKAGKPTRVICSATLADGLSVPLVGCNAFATAAPLVDEVVSVSEEFIALAILRLLEVEKCIVEGAGATGLAALMQGLLPDLQGKTVVVPLCGGNIDTTVLGRVLERGLVADKRILKLWVTISDRPGSLKDLCQLFGSAGASVKDIYFERAWVKSDMFSVQVQVVLEVRDSDHAKVVMSTILAAYNQVKFFSI